MKDKDKILEEAQQHRDNISSNIREASNLFHKDGGRHMTKEDALDMLQRELGVSIEVASGILSELVGDIVDPIVQIPTRGEKYVGILEYKEFEGAYGYLDYDDVLGERKRVVCQQCVNEAETDKEVTHATEGGKESSFQEGSSYRLLVRGIHSHYDNAHDVMPEEVETGATLISGTTIGGNEAFHKGNDGKGSGLNADFFRGRGPRKVGLLEDPNNDGIATPVQGITEVDVGNVTANPSTGGGLTSSGDSIIVQVAGGSPAGSIITGFDVGIGTITGVGVDSSDNIWVGEPGPGADSIAKVDATGSLISTTEFAVQGVRGIGFDSSDSLWVADNQDDSIYKFNQSASLVTQFAAASFDPAGVGIASDNSVWVGQQGFSPARIIEYDSAGTAQSSFTAPSSTAGGIGFDSNGSLWFSETSTDTIYKAATNGTLLDSFATPSSDSQGLDINSNDSLWVSDTSGSLYKMTSADTSGGQVGTTFTGAGDVDFPGDIGIKDDKRIELSTDDSVFINHNSSSNTVQIAGTPSTEPLGSILSSFSIPDPFPGGVDLDSNNCLWTGGDNTIYRFSKTGTTTSQIASPGLDPEGLAFDASGSLWVSDYNSDTIYKINLSSSIVKQFSSPSLNPRGLGIDSSDSLWNSDVSTESIYELDQNGTVLSKFQFQPISPRGVGLDSSDSLWIASSADTITKVNQTGSVISSFLTPSSNPTGVGIDTDGRIWNANNGPDKMYEFTAGNQVVNNMLVSDVSSGNLNIPGNLDLEDDNELQLSTDDCVALRYQSSDSTVRFSGQQGVVQGETITKFAAPSNNPRGAALDSDSCLWIWDTPNTIYELNQTGSQISTVSAPGGNSSGLDFDSGGSIWIANITDTSIYQINLSGSIVSQFATPCGNPRGIGFDSQGSIWHTDDLANSIYKLDTTGAIQKSFNSPSGNAKGITVDDNGSLWHGDDVSSGESFYKLDTNGAILDQFDMPSVNNDNPQFEGLYYESATSNLWSAEPGGDSIYELSTIGDSSDILSLERTTGNLSIDGSITEGTTL